MLLPLAAGAADFGWISATDTVVPGLTEGLQATSTTDGAFVYAAGTAGLRSYQRDLGTQALALVDSEEGDFRFVTLSSDGLHAYAIAYPSTIQIFERDVLTGELEPAGSVTAASAGVPELTNPVSIAASADGLHLYVACAGSDAVVRFAREVGSGALSSLGVTTGLPEPTASLLGPEDGTLYVATAGDDSLHVFTREPATGALAPIETHTHGVNGVSDLRDPRALAIPPDGRNLYLARWLGALESPPGKGAAFTRDPLTGTLTFLAPAFLGASLAAGDHYVWDAVRTYYPHGSYMVYLTVRERDPSTGALTLLDSAIASTSPYGTAIVAEDQFAYSADLGRVARVDRGTEFLTRLETHENGVGDVEGMEAPSQVRATPDGGGVLVLSETAIAIFARDRRTGKLDFVEAEQAGIISAKQIVLSPDARFVYVADAVGGILLFARDLGTGALDLVGPASQGPAAGVGAVTLIANGTFLYAYRPGATAVDAYTRNAATGSILQVSTMTSVSGLDRFEESPNDAFLYATKDYGLSGWLRFIRDTSSGALLLFQDVPVWRQGGIAPASNLATYVASGPCADDVYGCWGQVEIFDASTYSARTTRPAGVWSGGSGSALELSPDERFLYFGSFSRLVVLGTDPAHETLEFVDGETDGALDIAVSPDGASVYTIDTGSAEPDVLRVYAPEPGAASLALVAIASLALLRVARDKHRAAV